MKNFSAKNAEFETLTINNEAAISSADLGTAPNQIPLNKDLGSLAYQDAVNLDDVSADMLELRAIAAEISDSAVDVFVYDTSRDSDGGAWRKRTQHTSWYNEELNTATRGGRREFPAVAVIVAEANKVTIYDGDDPDLSMWMVFNGDVAGKLLNTIGGNTSLAALNGDIFVGCSENVYGGVSIKIAFISDTSFAYANNQITQWPTGISGRDSTVNYAINVHSYGLVNLYVNDVSMTILPNAPIDQDTGLPVPTIAVATDGGVSVIKDDGSVVDITVSNSLYSYAKNVNFTTSNDFITVIGGSSSHDYIFVFDGIPNSDNVMTIDSRIGSSQDARSMFRKNYIADSTVFDGFTIGNGGSQSQMIQTIQGDRFVCGNNYDGLTIIDDNNLGFQKKDLVYISSKYNTGWMPGDIKLATLSDTTVETIGESSDELLTGDNGTFDGGVGDWGGVHAILSVDANRLKVTSSTSTDTGLAYLDVDTVVGARYSLEVSIDIGTSPEVSLRVYNGAGFTDQNTFVNKDISGTYYLQFNAESSISRVVLANNSTVSGHYSFFDSINLKQTGELITNGDFSAGDDGNWLKGADTTATFSNDQLTISGTRIGGPFVYQNINLIAGQTYTFDFDIDSMTAGAASVYFGPSSNGIIVNSAGKYSYTFVYDASMYDAFYLLCSNDGNVVFNSVSLRPAVDDRSVNNNGLQIIGEINKTPVAPGADLVAYSGFSENNYLVQPYNEDLDFGTGDFCVMGWFKRNSNSTYHRIWNRADSRDHHRVEFYTDTTGNEVYFYTRDDSAYTTVKGTLPLGIWTYLVGVREGGTLKIYENGVLANSTTGVARDLTSENNAVLQIGEASSFDPGATFDGSIALFRISANVPTDAQIAKIYRDEKALFTDGAQATLHGTSDAVTALAYDEKTELLHVGTSSGRSDFSGLRRINNTTTAITTSISAHNNLIAEQ